MKKIRRSKLFIFLLGFVVLFFTIPSVNAQVAPIEISTIEDLDSIRTDLTASYVLTKDLDFNGCDSYADCSNMALYSTGLGWQPIGDYSAYPTSLFSGEFNGQNYTVSNLYISRSSTNYVGLFGFIGGTSEIKNINLIDVNVTGAVYTGGLVGVIFDSATLDNVYVKGDVSATTGGGVLAGYFGADSSLNNSAAEGSVIATTSAAIIGNSSGIMNNSHYSYEGILVNGDYSFNLGVLYEKEYNIWFSNGKSLSNIKIGDYFSKKDGYYLIKNIQDIKDLLVFGEEFAYKFKIANDLDFSGVSDIYIISFSGVLEGNNKKILNFTLSQPSSYGIGFIGNNKGIVRNLYLPDVNVTGNSYVGGAVGHNKESGRVVNVHATGIVEGAGYGEIGGLVGLNRGYINNSSTDVFIDSFRDIGGFVGLNMPTGVIENSNAKGEIIGNSRVSVFAGENHGLITNSYVSSGTVTSKYYTGGFVGRNYGDITNSFTHADIYVDDYYAGGFAGYIQDSGRIANSYSTGNVNKLLGGVNSGGYGAFIGVNSGAGEINNCFSIGSLYFEGEVDPNNRGFAGSSSSSAYETNSFYDIEYSNQLTSAGDATSKTTAEMKSISTFSDVNTTGLDTPWSISEINKFNPDGNTVWYIDEGYDYPRLVIEYVKPQILSKSASSISSYSALLNGKINHVGTLGVAKFAFQYRKKGTSLWHTTSYVTKKTISNISSIVQGLSSGTIYEYRVVAKYGSSNNLTYSNVSLFNTLSAAKENADEEENKDGVDIEEGGIPLDEDVEDLTRIKIQIIDQDGEPFRDYDIKFAGYAYHTDEDGYIYLSELAPSKYEVVLYYEEVEHKKSIEINSDGDSYKLSFDVKREKNWNWLWWIIIILVVSTGYYLITKVKEKQSERRFY